MLPLPGRDEFMHIQVAILSKGFTAVLADISVPPTMDQVRFHKVASHSRNLTTQLADMLLLLPMDQSNVSSSRQPK